MAKSKHATALFEVIHTAKRPPKASPSTQIPAPKWWFKSKSRGLDTVAASAAVEPEIRIVEKVVEVPVYIDREVVVEKPVLIHGEVDAYDANPVFVDKNNKELKFRLSYGGAAAVGLIAAVVMAFIYIAGTRSAVSSNDEDVAKPAAPGSSALMAAVEPSALAGNASTINPSEPKPAVAVTPSAPQAIATPAKVIRRAGLNYVIAQSYPTKDLADKAADFLTKSGVPCTVEFSLKSWSTSGWYSVIGTREFDHVQHNPDLESYKQKITDIGINFAGARMFNRFQPLPYKWRAEALTDN